jgi:hypothetical protein
MAEFDLWFGWVAAVVLGATLALAALGANL